MESENTVVIKIEVKAESLEEEEEVEPMSIDGYKSPSQIKQEEVESSADNNHDDNHDDDGEQKFQPPQENGAYFTCFTCHDNFDDQESYQAHYPVCISSNAETQPISTNNIKHEEPTSSSIKEEEEDSSSDIELTSIVIGKKPRKQKEKYIATCHICLKPFPDDSLLRQHINETHRNKKKPEKKRERKSKVHDCSVPNCSAKFQTAIQLKLHYEEHRRTSGKKYECEICHQEFDQGSELRRHSKIHEDEILESKVKEGETRCLIPDCRRVVKNDAESIEAHLLAHITIGEKSGRFICPWCKRHVCKDPVNFRQHLDEHSLIKLEQAHINNIWERIPHVTIKPDGVSFDLRNIKLSPNRPPNPRAAKRKPKGPF